MSHIILLKVTKLQQPLTITSRVVAGKLEGGKKPSPPPPLRVKAKEQLFKAGFNFKIFLSNSPELMKLINEREGTVVEQGSSLDGSLTSEDQSYNKSSLNSVEKIEESKVLAGFYLLGGGRSFPPPQTSQLPLPPKNVFLKRLKAISNTDLSGRRY